MVLPDMDMDMDMPGMPPMPGMKMYFHTGMDDTVLFEGWKPDSDTTYWVSLLAIVVFCLGKEWLFALRRRLSRGGGVRGGGGGGGGGGLHSVAGGDHEQVSSGPAPLLTTNNGSQEYGELYGGDKDGKRGGAGRAAVRSSLKYRALSAALYGLNLTMGYLVMLVVMTYNVGLGLAVIFGSALGHFLFVGDDADLAEPEQDCCDA